MTKTISIVHNDVHKLQHMQQKSRVWLTEVPGPVFFAGVVEAFKQRFHFP